MKVEVMSMLTTDVVDIVMSEKDTGVKGNKEAEKAAKQAINLQGMATTKLPYTDYYLTIRRARNSEWQRRWENSTNYRTLY